MLRIGDIVSIVSHSVCPYSYREGRKFSLGHLIGAVIIPAVGGAVMAWRFGVPTSNGLGGIVQGFAVLGAVLTALLATIQTVMGTVDVKEKYDAGAMLKERQRRTRLEVLRDLYALIAFAVLALVLSSVPIILLQWGTKTDWLDKICAGLVYAACVLLLVTFLHIVSGVYLVLDNHAECMSEQLEKLEEDARKGGGHG